MLSSHCLSTTFPGRSGVGWTTSRGTLVRTLAGNTGRVV
jgi:hypothetical protein